MLGSARADELPHAISFARGATCAYTTAISAINVDTGAITDIGKGRAVYGEINLNHTQAMFGMTMQNNDTAVEAYITRADGIAPAKVSAANSDLPKPPLGKMEVVRWKSSDGLEIEGILNYPVNCVPLVIRRALEKKSIRGPMNLPDPSQVVVMLG